MPKRQIKNSMSAMPKIVAALFRVREVHSPCINPECKVSFSHCAGCNEPFPCQTIHALEGTKPLNQTVTLYGDQYEESAETQTITTEVSLDDSHG